MARELVKHEYALKISSTYDEYITVSGENHWLVNYILRSGIFNINFLVILKIKV